MEPEPTVNPISTACVGDCKGHAADVPNWTQVTVVGGCDTARANVYQVAVAGVGGKATYKNDPDAGAHGIVAVASQFGHAISGDGGVAVSSGDGESTVGKAGYAYAKGGKAFAGSCSVAGTAGGWASAKDHGIAVGWLMGPHPARVEAGVEGVAIGDTGCFVKAGDGGVLIAMADPKLGRATKICRVGENEGEMKKDQWYEIQLDTQGQFLFASKSPPVWKTNKSPCPVPPKP